MYRICLGSGKKVFMEFERALIHVPGKVSWEQGVHAQWEMRSQQIVVRQKKGYALVVGLDGFPPQRGGHRIEIPDPEMRTSSQVMAYLGARASVSQTAWAVIESAIQVRSFDCGQVFSLNHGALGHAAGGLEYCLLPAGGRAISTGYLCLDWDGVRVREAA